MSLVRTQRYAVLLAVLCLCGCQEPTVEKKAPASYQTVAKDPARDTDTATRYNLEAAQMIDKGKLDKAEERLKLALAADTMYGPAHNNLGLVYFKQKKYYLGAWEFEYASKLMPTQAPPLNNLGLVYETVGRLEEATQTYEEALKVDPQDVTVMGNLARVYVRLNHTDDRTRQLLSDIALKDTRSEWAAWARERLVLMPRRSATTETAPAEDIAQ